MKTDVPRILLIAALLVAPGVKGTRAAELKGVVEDGTGAVIPFGVVHLRSGDLRLKTKTDNIGRFEFAQLRPGSYDMDIEAHGFCAWAMRGLEVAASNPSAGIVTMFTLGSGGAAASYPATDKRQGIEGALVAYTAPPRGTGEPCNIRPLKGVKVVILRYGTGSSMMPVETNVWGAFRFDHLQPGLYALRMSKDGYAECSVSDIRVRAGKVVHFGLVMGKGANPEVGCKGSGFGSRGIP